MKASDFPAPGAAGVRYAKSGSRPLAAFLALCGLAALAATAVDFTFLLLGLVLLGGAAAEYRVKTVITGDTVYHRPAFGAGKAIAIAALFGYSINRSGRFSSSIALWAGEECAARIAYKPEIVNILTENGLKAIERSGVTF